MFPQQIRDIDSMLVQSWPTVYDAGSTLNQHWVNVSCLMLREKTNFTNLSLGYCLLSLPRSVWAQGGGPRAVVSSAAFHARVRGSFPGLGGLKQTKLFLPNPLVKLSIVGGLRDREVPCSASDLQGFNFESCVWKAVSSHSFHHLQEVSWPNLPCMCTKVA